LSAAAFGLGRNPNALHKLLRSSAALKRPASCDDFAGETFSSLDQSRLGSSGLFLPGPGLGLPCTDCAAWRGRDHLGFQLFGLFGFAVASLLALGHDFLLVFEKSCAIRRRTMPLGSANSCNPLLVIGQVKADRSGVEPIRPRYPRMEAIARTKTPRQRHFRLAKKTALEERCSSLAKRKHVAPYHPKQRLSRRLRAEDINITAYIWRVS
jgi:hypothetical protein